jgi:predicted flavoprotein YhiN
MISSAAAQERYDFIVIGGGPAGLFAAIRFAEAAQSAAAQAAQAAQADAAQAGAAASPPKVLVLERKAHPCRKLLLSGSGQCNLTHEGSVEDLLGHYGSSAPFLGEGARKGSGKGSGKDAEAARFLKPALYACSNTELLSWFSARGLEFEADANGKYFPLSRKASSVLNLLAAEAKRLGVELRGGRRLRKALWEGGGFSLAVEREEGGEGAPYPEPRSDARSDGQPDPPLEAYFADRLLLATGGASYPATGSSGDGYAIASAFGHGVIEPRPALAPAYADDFPLAGLAGLSFKGAGLCLRREGRKILERSGDLLITHKGVSGPLILDASRDMRPGDTLELRFVDASADEFRQGLDALAAAAPKRQLRGILTELGLTRGMADEFCRLACDAPYGELTAAGLSREKRQRLCALSCAFPLRLRALGGMDEAMATAGGVALDGVDPKTMASRLVPGLYFAGELLDFVGDTGGYNLQAAFATGALAGASCLKAIMAGA